MSIVAAFALDVRLGLRRLRRDITFSTVAAACLILAIGGVTAVYSVIEPVLWRPLPFPDPDNVQVLQSGFTAAGGGRQLYAYSGENYVAVRDEQSIFDAMGALVSDQFMIGRADDAVVVPGVSATAGVFDVWRVPPVVGRLYTAAEERRGDPVAVISDGLWRRQFGGDPGIVGRRISINGAETVVAGVLPSATAYPQGTDIWTPLAIDRWSPRDLELGILTVLVRPRRDVNARARAETMSTLDAMLAERYPGRNTDRISELTPFREYLVGDLRPVMTGLLGAVTFLALIGAVNMGALMMARGRGMTRELSLRAVLGARPARLALQMLTETLVLCTLGGVGGVLLAWITLPALVALAPQDLPTFAPIALGRNGALIAMVLVLTFTVMAGTAPAFAVRREAMSHLRVRALTTSRRVRRTNDLLIGIELAVAMVLLAGAALFVLDLRRLTAVDPGVVPADVTSFRVRLPDEGYGSHERLVATYDGMLERLHALPGVVRAGAVHRLPFGDGLMGWSFSVEEQPPTRAGAVEVALARIVAGDYFATVGVPIVAGRAFDGPETLGATPVVVVSQALADRHWPGEDPIGKRIKRRAYDSDRPWLTIIGIAADVRDRGPAQPPAPVIYRPLSQTSVSYANQLTFVVHAPATGRDMLLLRRTVNAVEPLARVFDYEPYDAAVHAVTGPARFAATLLGIFAGLGLMLAGAGVFGMTLFVVHRRLPEIGIRRALGATQRTIVWETLRHGAFVALAGVAAGMVILVTVRHIVTSQVAAVRWFEPWALIPVALLLLSTAVLAAAIPARRGASVDPVSLFRG